MKSPMKNQIAGLLAFILFGAGVFSGLYFLVNGHTASASGMIAMESAVMGDGARALAEKPNQKIVLTRDRRANVGRTILVYRGLDDVKKVRIDVIVPELDPQVAYHYRISRKQGKKGFSLGRQQYRILSAGKNTLKILSEG